MLNSIKTKKNAILLMTYALFVLWYSHLGGPLTLQEQRAYLEKLTALGIEADQLERIRVFMASDDGDDFIMVNLIHLNPKPIELPATGPNLSLIHI